MSWMSQLYDTYENNFEKSKKDKISMEPIAHRNKNIQIEVTLDIEGNFQGAKILDREEENTLIPVTEASDNRTSTTIAPHMLSDSLPYVAGDFSCYCEQNLKESACDKFDKYIEQLRKWHESAETHPKVDAIYKYLSKKILMEDLINAGIVTLTDKKLLDTKKINKKSYEKVNVRFRVLQIDTAQLDGTWEDDSLIEAYTKYYLPRQSQKSEMCFFSGRIQSASEMHRKGVIKLYGNAKLISSNDTKGYTYLGRFQNAEQAYSLSYEASQKIHNALAWLINKQGIDIGGRIFLCWNPKGKDIPNIFEALALEEDMQDDFDIFNRLCKKKLRKSLQGYANQFEITDNVIVMCLDATSSKSGRLSITYYNEFFALDFLSRISEWGETCKWIFKRNMRQKTPHYKIETPSFRQIAECAFGQEVEKKIENQKKKIIEANDKVLKKQVQRLIKCMLEKQPMPSDFVRALAVHASTPMAYSEENWERVLSTACAVITKYYIDKGLMKGEEDEMKLDVKNRDRSYLFGRLLAILEKVERATYETGEGREPNAIRLQSAYVNHPLKTWMILEEVLKPYFQKLKPGSREYYRRLISEITELFMEDEQSVLNQGLSEMYLLGYYLQRAELNKKNDEKKEEAGNE